LADFSEEVKHSSQNSIPNFDFAEKKILKKIAFEGGDSKALSIRFDPSDYFIALSRFIFYS